MPALANAPVLSVLGSEMASIFNALSHARSGFQGGVNPISFAEIKAFIDLIGPPSLSMEIFVELLQRLDRKYLELSDEQTKAALERGRKS